MDSRLACTAVSPRDVDLKPCRTILIRVDPTGSTTSKQAGTYTLPHSISLHCDRVPGTNSLYNDEVWYGVARISQTGNMLKKCVPLEALDHDACLSRRLPSRISTI